LLLTLVLILVLQRLELLHFPLTSVELVHNWKSVPCCWAFTDCKSAYCILKIQHILENVAFEDKNLILREAYHKKEG
jgi:hypothetical protein